MTTAKPKPAKLVTCPACRGSGEFLLQSMEQKIQPRWIKCYRCDGAGVVARKAKLVRR